jgi:hypothetical protein
MLQRGKALPSPVGEILKIKSGRGGDPPAVVIAGNRDSAFLFFSVDRHTAGSNG